MNKTDEIVMQVHAMTVRIDERLERFIERVDKRDDEHSKNISDNAASVASIQRTIRYVQWWSAGAAFAVTGILGAAVWIASQLPSDVWKSMIER